MAKEIRITFTISPQLNKKCASIPWGLKGSLLRVLLEKITDSGEKNGLMAYGAILEGEYDIVPRSKK
jgi:hypothetical protein